MLSRMRLFALRTLARFVQEIRQREGLVHVTPLANREGIEDAGLCAPSYAPSVSSGLGSAGSNVDVVQLFDYTIVERRSGTAQLVDLLGEPCFAQGAAIFEMDRAVRGLDTFVSHHDVRVATQKVRPALRYYPNTEVWVQVQRLDPKFIARVHDVRVDVMRDAGCTR
jgi:hypothetical protein